MKVLLATDGTAHGEVAADMLSKLRLAASDEIRIVCVVDMAIPFAIDVYGGYIPETAELERSAKENAETVVDSTLKKVKGALPRVEVTAEVLFGSPDSRIVETAEEWPADLIVMGSHGYNAWERLLLGSVSDSVVHHAPCSVLIARKAANG